MVHGIIGKKIPPKEITLGNGEPLEKKCLKKRIINRYARAQ